MSRQSRMKTAGFPHMADDIRDHTMQLSSRPIQAPMMSSPNISQDAFIFPTSALHSPVEDDHTRLEPLSASISSALMMAESMSDLSASTSTVSVQRDGVLTPRGRPSPFQSGISLLRSHQEVQEVLGPAESQMPTPVIRPREFTAEQPILEATPPSAGSGQMSMSHRSHIVAGRETPVHERRPLLGDVENGHSHYHSVGSAPNGSTSPRKSAWHRFANTWRHRVLAATKSDHWHMSQAPSDVLRALPAVLLGTLLNVLDGISCK